MTTLDGEKSKMEGRILKWCHEVPVPELPNVNYGRLMVDLMAQYGDKVAVVDANTEASCTYNALCEKILKLHDGFKSAGIGPGDAVMLISVNHMEFPTVTIALALAGITCVPTNPKLTKDDLTHVARVSEAKWVITNTKTVGKIKEAYAPLGPGALKQIWIIDDDAEGMPSLADLMASGQSNATNRKIEHFDSTKTIALMPFSSGTTGLPKGVLLSHRNFIATYMQGKYQVDVYPGEEPINFMESTLLLIPMFHIYGFNTLMSALSTGGKIVILNRFSPEKYFQTIEKHQVTYSPIVPHIVKFLSHTELMEKYNLSSLLLFISGSSPISQSALEALTDKSGKIAMQAYGMTETCATVSANGGVAGSKPESLGKVSPYVEAKVIDVETGELLPEGEEGELCVRGPGVTLGYANNPKATAETIDAEGWLHTGDLFYYDEDDFLFITDRIKDLIKVKGYQVAPTELENLLLKLDEIQDVAVAGVPNERLGEAPRAWIVPAEGATIDPKALMQYVADNVVSYKQLVGGIEVVDSIPRNHLGKILRRELQKSYVVTRSKL